MGKTFTRQQLYELVWDQPRTTLAKQLGISDVWISKQCVNANIPAPPLGYWARKQSGKPTLQIDLPMRLPGLSNLVTFGESASDRNWNITSNLDESIVKPSFDEDIDLQVTAAMKIIGRVAVRCHLSAPHVSLKKILAAEAKRREKFAAGGWSFDKPRFDGPVFQRQLSIFNSISQATGRAYGRNDVYECDEWVQGRGTSHHLRFRLNLGSIHFDMTFLEPLGPDAPARAKGPPSTTLRVGGEYNGLGIEEWSDNPKNKLERQLEDVVKALLYRAERTLRNDAQRHYEWQLDRRKQQLEEIKARECEVEKKRRDEILARREQFHKQVVRLAEESRAATDIRAMVNVLTQHPGLTPEAIEIFEAWKSDALDVADQLDPLKRPIRDLLVRFDGSS